MNQPTPVYPDSPINVPESVTRTSAAFKKEVSKVMGSIVLFFIVYLVLIALAIALAIAAVYGGITIIINYPRIFTIMAGIGLIGMGVMVLFFLIKFVVAVTRFDHSGSIEITEEDHPKLFEFIRRLTQDTQTPFPKRIYLSPEVNACVFYDSGFWSMFLPVKKNLQIGLGLVNSVNLSEFKAIMAHEFGHFSQRSMKLGSFVYNVNRVIYNMLYENTSYGRSLEKWASVSDYFSFFATITVGIVTGIQKILREMYGLINKNYMGLSREMEFHADAVAASVSGSNNCISALRRIEMAGACYGIVVEKCAELFKEKSVSENVYHNQHSVIKQYAEQYNLSLQNGLPVVSEALLKTHNNSRVNYKDQWASHPSLEEREKNLSQLAVPATCCHDSAWVLFENAPEWQQRLTGKVYNDMEKTGDLKILDKQGFEEILLRDQQLHSFPETYNGFYDKRDVTKMDIAGLCKDVAANPANNIAFEKIFNSENAGLHQNIFTLEMDINILNAIAEKKIATKTFDFDGEKYKAGEAKNIAASLQKEMEMLKQKLETQDKNAFCYFYRKALQVSNAEGEKLKDAWKFYFEWKGMAEGFLNRANETMATLLPLYTGQTLTMEQVNGIMEALKLGDSRIKPMLKRWLEEGAFDLAPGFKTALQSFLTSEFQYFSGDSFFDNELRTLYTIINDGWRHINDFQFRKFKQILEMQLHYN